MAEPTRHDKPGATVTDWSTLRLWQIQPLRDVMIILAVVGLLYLGYVLSIVTVPILLAGALAYLFEPSVKRLTKRGRMSRRGAAVLIIVCGTTFVLVPLMGAIGFGLLQGAGYVHQVAVNINTLVRSVEDPTNKEFDRRLPSAGWRTLRDRLAEMRRETQRARESLGESVGNPNKQLPGDPPPGDKPAPPSPGPQDKGPPGSADASSNLPPDTMALAMYGVFDWIGRWMQANIEALSKQAVKSGTNAIELIAGGIVSFGMTLFGLFLTVFFFFFLCSRWPEVQRSLHSLVPERRRERVMDLVGQMDHVIAAFIRGRITISVILGVYFAVAYYLIGVGAPVIMGVLVGILCMVPYAATAAIPVVMITMWLRPGLAPWQDEWSWIVFAPLGVHIVAQIIDDYVLTPSIQGKHTGMDTPAIVFASIAGGTLGGFFGLLLAIPAAACIKILVREIVAPQFRQWAKGNAPDPLPIGGPASTTIKR